MPSERTNALIPVAIVALLVMSLCAGGCAGGERIHSSGSKEFTKGPPARISRSEAYVLMRQDPKFEDRQNWWFAKEGLDIGLMVGRWHAFVEGDKHYRSFQGYYVNADSGEVEYRSSDKKIWEGFSGVRSRAYPSDWTSVERVEIPKHPNAVEKAAE